MSVVKLGSNIASLTAQRRLAESTQTVSRVYERLSSGLRINRASDDAAGLSISQSLRADAKVFAQGIRNLNDGVSLLNVADSAIEQLSGITVRLTELAEQAANGSYGVKQRQALDAEAQALSKEFTRIAQSTSFNGVNLLNGNLASGVRLQAGFGSDGSILAGVGGAIGTGTFGATVTYVTPDTQITPGDVNGSVIADINADGFNDLVTAETADGANGAYFIVRMSSSGGTLAEPQSYYQVDSIGFIGGTFAVSDINNDGVLDLLGSGLEGVLHTFLGNGDGSFRTGATYTSTTSGSIFMGDVDGDGNVDLLASNGVTVTIRRGLGDGTFGSAATENISGGNLRTADFNSDGLLDLAVSGSGAVSVYLGNGNGSLAARVSYAMQTSVAGLRIGDANGDGIADLLTAGTGVSTVMVRLGQGDGTFGSAISSALSVTGTTALGVGDLNGDGLLDVATTRSIGAIEVKLGRGDGSFGNSTTYSGGRGITIGDLSGDGVHDVVTHGYYGATYVRQGVSVAGVGALLPFSMGSIADARQALSLFTQKRNQLSTQRGITGAFQSRVTSAVNTLTSARENYLAAESRITDADIAQESASLVRLNILRQAASSVLAQANQQPQLAIRLLEDQK